MLLVHYDDLLVGLAGQVRHIAASLGIDVPTARLPTIVEGATFAAMRRKATVLVPDPSGVPDARVVGHPHQRAVNGFVGDHARDGAEPVADLLGQVSGGQIEHGADVRQRLPPGDGCGPGPPRAPPAPRPGSERGADTARHKGFGWVRSLGSGRRGDVSRG